MQDYCLQRDAFCGSPSGLCYFARTWQQAVCRCLNAAVYIKHNDLRPIQCVLRESMSIRISSKTLIIAKSLTDVTALCANQYPATQMFKLGAVLDSGTEVVAIVRRTIVIFKSYI
jgi:hypothetical protein